MKRIAMRLTRRSMLLSLLTLAMFKNLTGLGSHMPAGDGEKTVLSGGWLLKKSDLS